MKRQAEKPMETDMCNDCINDACEALMRWFETQRIAPKDAVLVMAKGIAALIAVQSDNEAHYKEGIRIITKMIREISDHYEDE